MSKKKPGPHPLDVPDFLKRKKSSGKPTGTIGSQRVSAIRMPTASQERDPLSGHASSAREEVARYQTAPEALNSRQVKRDNKFKRWKAFDKTKNFNPKTMRWDPARNRVVDDRPLRNLDNAALKELKFNKLSGPDLVRAYNELIYVAACRGGRGLNVIRRFSSNDVGQRRCDELRNDLLGRPPRRVPIQESQHAPASRGDTTMAKAAKTAKVAKTAKKKADGESIGKVRDKTAPVGKVADFKPVRAGTDRGNLVNFIRGGSKPIDEVAKAIGKSTKTASMILHFLNRDKGFGYTVAGGSVSLQFPGSMTWQDAIKKAEEKKAA